MLLTVMFNRRKPMYYHRNSRAFDLDVYALWGRHKKWRQEIKFL